MKNFSLGMIAAILLLVCCTGSTQNNQSVAPLPKVTHVATGRYGVVSKYKDGYNTIYLYESSSGGSGSIAVVSE
jgi:hypothetical protein